MQRRAAKTRCYLLDVKMGARGEETGLFHVSIHDVAPVWAAEIDAIFAALTPLAGTTMSAAVVPCWGGEPFQARDAGLVSGRADEVLLHGWQHRRERGRGVVSFLTGGADEFSRLPRDEAIERLLRGREVLGSLVDAPIDGFLPPAYQAGAVDSDVLAAVGLRYRVGWASANDVDGHSVRLATRIWDVSPVAVLSRFGASTGRIAELRPGAVPTITVHPLDVRRGFLPHVIQHVRALLAAGRRPALVRDLLAREHIS